MVLVVVNILEQVPEVLEEVIEVIVPGVSEEAVDVLEVPDIFEEVPVYLSRL